MRTNRQHSGCPMFDTVSSCFDHGVIANHNDLFKNQTSRGHVGIYHLTRMFLRFCVKRWQEELHSKRVSHLLGQRLDLLGGAGAAGVHEADEGVAFADEHHAVGGYEGLVADAGNRRRAAG
jgi:hypothetical protein